MGGLVHLHEPEERFEVPLSVANQAAAFERISRSSFSLRFSRRNRASSSRSARRQTRHRPCRDHAVLPDPQRDRPGRRPELLDKRSAGLRPLRTKSTICRLNSGVYRTLFSAIVNTSISYVEVSTKPGQLQNANRAPASRYRGPSTSPLEVTRETDAARGCEEPFARRRDSSRRRGLITPLRGGFARRIRVRVRPPVHLVTLCQSSRLAASFIAIVPSIKAGARASSSGKAVLAPVASPGASRLCSAAIWARLTLILSQACGAGAARAQWACDF